MKSTVLFLIVLSLTSLSICQKAFDSVNNLLINFKADIVKEQSDADIRNRKDIKECAEKRAAAEKKVGLRQKDVDDLTAHIKYLNNEKTESEKDRKTRQDRIVANKALLEKFKSQRCDNNLLFVKNLREHMEAIEILTLLRGDIVSYFKNKNAPKVAPTPVNRVKPTANSKPHAKPQTKDIKNPSPNYKIHAKGSHKAKLSIGFIQRFSEFSHLLTEDKKAVFAELVQQVQNLPDVDALTKRVNVDTAEKIRTSKQVGVGHIDNTRGELQRLSTPGYEHSAEYYVKLQIKILSMIDGLVLHLRESRNELTKNEIKAAEDFAIFQTTMERENEHLQEKIKQLTAHIVDLTNQINISNGQLVKRKKLLQEAQEELRLLIVMCQEKSDYYKRESGRRSGELVTVQSATEIFNKVLKNLSVRVKSRAQSSSQGVAFSKADSSSREVVATEPGVSADYNANIKSRAAVVF